MSDGLPVCLPPLVAWVVAINGYSGGPLWSLFALSVAQSVALVWHRRFPLTVLVVVTALEVSQGFFDLKTLFVGFLVAGSGLGAWGRPLQRRIGLVFGLSVLAVGLAVAMIAGNGTSFSSVSGIGVVAVLFVGFFTLGRLGARQRGRIHALDVRAQRLEADREHAERRAAERERVLLARELHDILNHAVTTMVVDAEATAETGDDTETRTALRRVSAMGRGSLAELRRLLGVLRQPVADHDPLVPPAGLDQLDGLVASMPEGGPRVRLEREGAALPVDASVDQAAYRVVQEALTNAARHAGAVDVDVRLAYAAERLTVRVSHPAPTDLVSEMPGGGLGLVGMRERVELVGGSLEAGHLADGGFEVLAHLPVRGES